MPDPRKAQDKTPSAAAPQPASGGPRVRAIPDGDTLPRLVCPECGFVSYENPKVVVGAVVTWEGRFLLCRRAIHPRKGYWTLPAGYLEQHETTLAGAAREAREEACAEIEIDALLGIYNIPRISQVQLIYRARLRRPEFAPGIESQDVVLFEWTDIPWDDLAFPSVGWALRHSREVEHETIFAPRTNPPGETGNY